MKLKSLILGYLIAAITLFPFSSGAVTYYACNASQNINGDSTWCTSAHRTGSCSGDGTYTAWGTITTSDILMANGCTVIIPNTASTKFDVSKITNKTDGTGTDGGQFTYVTAASYTPEIAANIEAGGTTGACLAISGTSGAGLKIGYTKAVTITGGSASSIAGISDTHSGTGNDVLIGSSSFAATLKGGTNSTTTYAYLLNGTGSTVIYGNSTAVANGFGIYLTAAGSITHTGNCTGSDSVVVAGCGNNAPTGTYILTGSIISGTKCLGVQGNITYTPAATDYILIKKDASYAAGTIDAHATEMPSDPGKANVKSGTEYGSFTGTLDVSGSGSPYAY